MSKAEEEANKRYCITRGDDTEEIYGIDMQRASDYIDGYHQAEKNLRLNWEDIKDRFLSEFLARTLEKKLGMGRMCESDKKACNEAYTPDPYQPDTPRYPYFEAYKEGYLAAMSIAEDILVKMFNEHGYSDHIEKAPAETDGVSDTYIRNLELDSLKVREFMELKKIDIQKQKI